MYRKRHAESVVRKLSEMFGAILVAGPRQVGKTTMLKTLTKDIGYVTLDDIIVRTAIILRQFSWMKSKRRPFCLNKSKCILTAIGRKGSFICAGRSNSR